jgi:hypothetical protein
VVTEKKSDITLPKTDELSYNALLPHTALTGGDRAGDERRSISVMAITNDEDRESPKDRTDFDYLDGTTIVAEVCESLHIHKLISHQATALFGTT